MNLHLNIKCLRELTRHKSRYSLLIIAVSTLFFICPLNAGEYTHVDEFVLNKTNLNEKDILQLTYQLTHPFEKTEDKVRAVFKWITANIEYDLDLLQNKNKRAKTFQEVLDRKKDVCNGYAMLFKAMMDKAGINCEIIYGFSKGYNYEIGNLFNDNNLHAWNAVKIKNKWHLIDATWGAGYIHENHFVRSFNDYYFFTPSEELIQTHYPEERRWQLLDKKVHKDEFENFVYLKPAYFNYNIKIISHNNYTIETANSLQVKVLAPQDIMIEANILYGENKLDQRYVFTQRKNNTIEINAIFPYAESYILRLFAKKNLETIPYHWILDYHVITNRDANASAGFPEKYGAFDLYNTYVFFPLSKFLSPGKEIEFKLRVNNCEKVALIHEENFNFFNKNKDFFEGKFIIPEGKFFIASSKPGSNQFNYLLEYESW
jgi:hypothetical protein